MDASLLHPSLVGGDSSIDRRGLHLVGDGTDLELSLCIVGQLARSAHSLGSLVCTPPQMKTVLLLVLVDVDYHLFHLMNHVRGLE